MRPDILLLIAVGAPVIGACFLPLAARLSPQARTVGSLGCILASFVASLGLLPVAAGGTVVTVHANLALIGTNIFAADNLAVFVALFSSLISAIIVLYSFGYISHYQNQTEYYTMVTLFLGAMMGLVFAANLIILYIFWEITAITSWRLIGFFREKAYVLKADKAFLVTIFGALAMLIGFISIYQQTGSFDLAAIHTYFLTQPLGGLAIALILMGILSKSATLPFHVWLPDAGVAPSPVTALLHAAILVKIGVYVFARLFIVTVPIAQVWQTAVLVLAAASALVAAGAALVETDLKRIIAYSTISQIGFIFFGLAIGSPAAVFGGLLYILMHGIAKAGLFLSAGIIEQNTKTKDVLALGGLITTMPVTAVSFLLCAFSVMGVPPFGGFFSKYLVFAGAIGSGNFFIATLFFIAAIMTIIYLLRMFNLIFFGQNRFPHVREGSAIMVASVAALGIGSLLGGIFIAYPAAFAQLTVAQMFGGLIR